MQQREFEGRSKSTVGFCFVFLFVFVIVRFVCDDTSDREGGWFGSTTNERSGSRSVLLPPDLICLET